MPRPDMAWKQRWVLVAAALVAASCFALSVQGGRWWWIGDSTIDLAVGPLGIHNPINGGTHSWDGASERWQRLGAATWAGGMVAMFVLVVVAGALAAKRVPRRAAGGALVAIGTATVAAAGLGARRPAA